MSADPLAVHAPGQADLNLYAYVHGQVLRAIDPLGLSGVGAFLAERHRMRVEPTPQFALSPAQRWLHDGDSGFHRVFQDEALADQYALGAAGGGVVLALTIASGGAAASAGWGFWGTLGLSSATGAVANQNLTNLQNHVAGFPQQSAGEQVGNVIFDTGAGMAIGGAIGKGLPVLGDARRGFTASFRNWARYNLGLLEGSLPKVPNLGPVLMPELPFLGRIGSGAGSAGSAGVVKPSLSAHKEALKKVHAEVGGPLPKGKPGKFGSPQAGDAKKGYRLDPPHDGVATGDAEEGFHFNWWDYTMGKRGRGGRSGAVPIEE